MGGLRKAAGFFIAALFLVWVLWYINENKADFYAIFDLDFVFLLLISLSYIPTLLFTSIFNSKMIQSCGYLVSGRQFFHITVISTFLNITMPMRGGAGFRAIYLKHKYSFDYSSFAATLAGTYILNFFVLSLVGLITALLIWISYGVIEPVSLAMFLLFFILLGTILLSDSFDVTKLLHRLVVIKKLKRAIESWQTIKANRKVVFCLLSMTGLNMVFGSLITFFAFKAIGIDISLVKILFFTVVSSFAALINITPAGLGIVEGTMIFVARDLNILTSQILLASLVSRITTFIVTAILVPPALIMLFGNSWRQDLAKITAQGKVL